MCTSSKGSLNVCSREEERGGTKALGSTSSRKTWKILWRNWKSSDQSINSAEEMNEDQYPVWPEDDGSDRPANPYCPA